MPRRRVFSETRVPAYRGLGNRHLWIKSLAAMVLFGLCSTRRGSLWVEAMASAFRPVPRPEAGPLVEPRTRLRRARLRVEKRDTRRFRAGRAVVGTGLYYCLPSRGVACPARVARTYLYRAHHGPRPRSNRE